MLFAMDNGPDTTLIASTGTHDQAPGLKGDEVDNLALFHIELDRIVDLDGRVGVTDRPTVVGDEVGDALLTELDAFDLAEFVGRFFG